MMKSVITGTAMLTLSAFPAAAQSDAGQQQSGGGSDAPASATVLDTAADQLIPGARFQDAPLYVTGDADSDGWTASTVYERIGDGWSEVGTVSDLVVAQDSAYAGVVGDVDDRRVFLSIQDLALVLLDDGEVAYLTQLGADQLAELPEIGDDTLR